MNETKVVFALTSQPPSMLSDGRMQFLNVARWVNTRHGWNDPTVPALWLYNLHYFDDLNADRADTRISEQKNLIHRWIDENPPSEGVGWDPYPASLRIVNWIKWIWRTGQYDQRMLKSLYIQCRCLFQNIEWHLEGNHLLSNAKALIFAGLFFKGPEAVEWNRTGMRIWNDQLNKQILSDGGHYELSPMYQGIVTQDLLDVIYLLKEMGCSIPQIWRTRAQQMLTWLRAMSHGDGDISFFNDAATGICLSFEELCVLAENAQVDLPDWQKEKSSWLGRASGYARLTDGSALLIADCANVGPDFLPAHAHADTLSFEFSIGKRRIFVNSGTSEYGLGHERDRQRGTSAHNTVIVDGQNSSETWSGFRVARRARTKPMTLRNIQNGHELECEHDGYLRLGGGTIHHRKWIMEENTLKIQDRVSGKFGSARSRVHIHPDVKLIAASENLVTLSAGSLVVKIRANKGASFRLVDSSYHPAFGSSIANLCLEMELVEGRGEQLISWRHQAEDGVR